MTVKIQVGSPQIAIHQGHSVLLTETDGQIDSPSDKGLFFYDTRLVSSWRAYVNGASWELLNGAATSAFAARVFMTNPPILTEKGPVAAHTLGLCLTRHIHGGVHEDLDLTNQNDAPVRIALEIAVRSDFADLFEVKSGRLVRRGHVSTQWSDDAQRLATTYRNAAFERTIAITCSNTTCPAVYANGRIAFSVDLPPHGSWHTCLRYDLSDGHHVYTAPGECYGTGQPTLNEVELEKWQASVIKLESSNNGFERFFRQAIDDLAALRLPVRAAGETHTVPAAGLPWFVALFGRDTLISSLQTAFVHAEFATATLAALGAWQATERDDYRDAEPGKILHELRLGELAALKLVPHTPYYGSADATPLYLIALHTAWMATGDDSLLTRYLPAAERCLTWIDEFGDRDGDGFQEYETRSSAGLENQSWKDSGDALVYPDGSLVKGPKALCELQGYVYDAWLRMATIYDHLGHGAKADALRGKADDLFRKFNEVFWDEEAGFYAFALDGEKNKVMSVASNPGHCLWSGIVPEDRARRVVARLMQPDMFSGWGIRTLSSDHAAFNPYAYQKGAVWPHDNGMIAQGMQRYGFAAEAGTVAKAIFEAGEFFALGKMPELYAGLTRDATNFPVQYLGANVPQAWAAGSIFSLVQAMLGLEPDAPARKLYVDPCLPVWLKDVTLRACRVGDQTFDIRFWREDDGTTRFQVLKGDAAAVSARSSAAARRLLAGRATV
ncbi:trehalase family glycosidase [Robbsia sp. Bb-Pol-6]|uniref:Trehalase family glycosidase n=1 Tax=Robbsia betulipollinis TaxID=2981849 RepID=A0ABT3ZL51_9BURK|nr:glycogen debranching N-terminal domain-containing protein [Robbsia betulipollinis]MCY0386673.1 trehalase family glycosidase [Robbsia betulipollinis]